MYEIYFAVVFFRKVRYCQNIFDIYFNALEIYFGIRKNGYPVLCEEYFNTGELY